MAKPKKWDEETVLEKFRSLPSEGKREAIAFLDFLSSGGKTKEWLEFDEWALNLAKKKGFDRLTEDDVACIVSDLRSEK